MNRTEVLVAMRVLASEGAVGSGALTRRLEARGCTVGSSKLLTVLLELEAAGEITVTRSHQYSFELTPAGRASALHLGGGQALEAIVGMVDLVGFTAFTAHHGDDAARDAAGALVEIGEEELSAVGARVVKTLGDGLLFLATPGTDLVGVLRNVRQRLRRPDGNPWQVRAALRTGTLTEHDGDVFGADVNLVSRLCSAADPDQVLIAAPATAPEVGAGPGDVVEQLTVRGVDEPVQVRREALA